MRVESKAYGLTKIIKMLARLLPKIICIFDDIPFLLMQSTGSVGVYMLVGAGFLIFPIQMAVSIRGLRARKNRSANAATLAFSSTGLAVTGCLLAFVIVSFPIFAAAASMAIPAIMSVIGAVELIQSVAGLRKAKANAAELSDEEQQKAVTDAARGVIFSSMFMFFSLAITALAVLGVMSGLGVVSMGIIPSAILIGVVVASLALKIFEIADNKIGKKDGNNHRATNAIHRGWKRVHSNLMGVFVGKKLEFGNVNVGFRKTDGDVNVGFPHLRASATAGQPNLRQENVGWVERSETQHPINTATARPLEASEPQTRSASPK